MSTKRILRDSRPLLRNTLRGGFSLASEIRSKFIAFLTSLIDIWEVTIGVVAFLHLIAVIEVSSVSWLTVTIIPGVAILLLNAWQHGILRARAEQVGERTSTQVSNSPIFKATLARLLIIHLAMNFMIFIYVYTKEDRSVIEGMPTNGLWSFVNVLFSLFLLVQVLGGLSHVFIGCLAGGSVKS